MKLIMNERKCIKKNKSTVRLITHSQREAYMVLVRNGGSGSGGSGGSGRQLSQNPQAI